MTTRLLFTLAAGSILLVSLTVGAGAEVRVINMQNVNTEADEDDPFVAGDGLTLLYSSNKMGTFGIYASKRTGAGQPFGVGKATLASKDADVRSPFLYKGVNLDLYYATNEVPDEKLKDLKNFDIVRRVGERSALPLLGVSEKEDEMHPWITKEGKEFYFSRKHKDGWVMYLTTGVVPGPGLAKPVGFEPGYCRASLNASGLIMYLQGPLEGGRTGLYRARRAKVGGAWSKPEPIPGMDHPEAKRGNMSPCVRDDRLYFASDRAGGKGGLDLHYVMLAQLK